MILKELRTAENGAGHWPRLTTAVVLPERGMMLAELRARLADGSVVDLVTAPPRGEVAGKFGGAEDFAGNASFGFGAAILLPYANRIRGRPLAAIREIETQVLGRRVRLPMNWGGKVTGAERYAMHGLILDRPFEITEESGDRVRAVLRAGDFAGRWPSAADIVITYRLTPVDLVLTVEVLNAGPDALPMGIGWHPYFAIPSGDRRAARLRVPARRRLLVDNYDDALPTGKILPVKDTPYDFSTGTGRRLGDMYLDDCFTDLRTIAGNVTATLVDPSANVGIAINAAAPPVKAFQVYAPPEKPFVAIEPQFNFANPYGAEWAGADTGMVVLQPGERTTYAARVEVFIP